MEKNLSKWDGNNKMFNKLLKSIKSKFKLKTSFSVYDPNDDMFVDDIDDLCGCYIGYENDYDFILSLHVKAPNEPLEAPPKSVSAISSFKNKKLSETNGNKPSKIKAEKVNNVLNERKDDNDDNNDDIFDNLEALQLKSMESIKPELQIERRKSHRLSVDFSIFNNDIKCQLNTVWLDFGAAHIKHCDMLNRLISAIKYYDNLDIDNNVGDKEEFNNFFDDTYRNMLDDYLHVITEHNMDLEEIHNSLRNKYHFNDCNINKCAYSKRHFQSKLNDYNLDDDPWINFYIETYDSLHFWLFHLYSVGLRSKKKDIINDEKECDQLFSKKQCYDPIFSKMTERINIHKQETDILFTRYSLIKKFDLNVTRSTNLQNIVRSKDSERLTFRDSMMIHIQKTTRSVNIAINKLHQFINDELYDSDAIKDDIDADHGEFSNIANTIRNQLCLSSIKKYIKNTKLSSSSYTIGLIFWYWPYYKKQHNDISDVGDDVVYDMDIGYSTDELYVEMKHATFKQEILEYQYINIWEYNNLIVLKAKQYQQTAICKSINIKFNPHLHYDVESGILTRENLIALVLYTDFDQLSAEFASTFRQIRLNESLESIKSRNRSYWWMSKTLREIVQYFGDNGSPSGQNVKGPFYTGMDVIINIREFNIRLCSPVSTSAQIEVITRFRGSSGIIMQLNNNGDFESARYLRSFNLNWISKYKEEDERLFIGGDWRIRIETIYILKSKQNFNKYFDTLFLFDCMCSGYDIDDPTALKEGERPSSPTKSSASAAFFDSGDIVSKQQKKRSGTRGRSSSTVTIPTMTSIAGFPDISKLNGKNKMKKKPQEISKKIELEKSKNYEMIKKLINNKLGNISISSDDNIPLYVISAFNRFCREKKVITLNIFYLEKNFSFFTDLIMNKIEVDTYKTMNTPWMPNPYSNKNTLQSRLFTLFNNVNKLIIYSTKYDGFPSYSFSLLSLLSTVEFRSTFKEIIIKATWDQATENKKNGKRSWIHTMFNTSPLGAVKQILHENQCKISLKKEKNSIGHWEDWLVIDRE